MACPSPEPVPLELLARIQALEARVAALEAAPPEPEAVPPVRAGPPAGPEESLGGGTVLALAGRAFLILGGAFLIRSLTDSGTLPAAAGVALGLGYAALWALLAHRSATKGPWAAFQILAGLATALPLLWETTVRLKVVPPGLAAAALLLWTVLLAGVAIRHGLRRVAWMTVLGSLLTGFLIMAATSAIAEFSPFFTLASGATLLLADRGEWRNLRWPAAVGADLAILVMIILALDPGGSEALARDLRPGLVQALALAWVGVHLGAFLHSILRRPRAVGAYEVFQTFAILVLGLGGTARLAQASGGSLAVLGTAALAFGLLCYACAFAFVEKQAEGSLDFKYLTSLAVLLVLTGSLLILGPRSLALACLALAAGTTFLGVRFARLSLRLHGLLFLVTASAASGLLAGAGRAFLGAVPGLGEYSAAAWLTLAGLAAAHGFSLGRRGANAPWESRIPSLGFGALAVFALGGIAISALASAVKDPGALAAARTATLVAMAAGSALAGRRAASELPWLAYPILGCAAVKLLLEDLPKGRPATMFLAFTLFGAGLLLVPRLMPKVRM